ncbi:hypothetical protein J6590_006474 [Homalodisca vitripennis]|nr:hypothetical protein J6590_006474 [Homalodisca vitripennis]
MGCKDDRLSHRDRKGTSSGENNSGPINGGANWAYLSRSCAAGGALRWGDNKWGKGKKSVRAEAGRGKTPHLAPVHTQLWLCHIIVPSSTTTVSYRYLRTFWTFC